MKKSEQYRMAIHALLGYDVEATLDERLEAVETLMQDRRMALYSEEPMVINVEAATE